MKALWIACLCLMLALTACGEQTPPPEESQSAGGSTAQSGPAAESQPEDASASTSALVPEGLYEAEYQFRNETGTPIAELYLSAENDEGWGDDLLEGDVFGQGQAFSFGITFLEEEPLWDLLVVDPAGMAMEFGGLDVSAYNTFTLTIEDGEPTVTGSLKQ